MGIWLAKGRVPSYAGSVTDYIVIRMRLPKGVDVNVQCVLAETNKRAAGFVTANISLTAVAIRTA